MRNTYNDDLLGSALVQAAKKRPAPGLRQDAPKKSAGGCDGFLCLFVTALLCSCYVATNGVPKAAQGRLQFAKSVVNGDLQRQTEFLRSDLRKAQENSTALNHKLAALTKEEDALAQKEQQLGSKLVEAQTQEETVSGKFAAEHVTLGLVQTEAAITRKGLDTWQRRAADLDGKLAKARVEKKRATEEKTRATEEAQRWHTSFEKADKEVRVSHQHLDGMKQQVRKLESDGQHLQDQLQKEVHWHELTKDKLHHFKKAELSLMQSLEIETRVAADQ